MKSISMLASRADDNLPPLVKKYLQASLSENTRKAYASDIQHFIRWGGRLPASPECVASYLAANADKLSMATLSRRVVAIGKAHALNGMASPAQTELVRATLRGMSRVNGSAQRQVKPVLPNEIQRMVSGLMGTKGVRDRALMLVGFAGAFRRSELVSLRVEDVEFVRKGMLVSLRRGKTDQAGAGRVIAIPNVNGKLCPVKALKVWLSKSGIDTGAIFRRVNRYGQVLESGMSAQSVALVVKSLAGASGMNAAEYSGHSLRAGLVTSAAVRGVSAWRICQQTGHQSEGVMRRYIRDAELFKEHPLRKVW